MAASAEKLTPGQCAGALEHMFRPWLEAIFARRPAAVPQPA